jgi:anaerobic dimethyl sulfoxide reductase subunit A
VCIIKVHIRDGKIWAIEPDDTINRGIAREDGHVSNELIDKCMITARPCTKAYAHIRNLNAPNRLLYPMKRVGEKGAGKWERISWDEALDTIANKLKYYKEKYGPYSIGGDWNDFTLSSWFGAGVADWGIHSKNGIDEPERWVLGNDGHGDRQDESNLLKSKLIVLWGFNPATTLSNHVIYTMMRARERGIPIISIEPRYTPTAETVASQWIPIRPTTDVAMMIAMANVWFKEDLCDKEFIKKWVEPDGLRLWKDYVLGVSDGVDKTPRWAEKICGVPAETITEFARLYACSKPVNLNISFSLGRQFWGENGIRAGIYLQALTGNTMTPGGTASAESACEFGQHEPTLPKPIVDWQRAPGAYRSPILLAHFKWPEAVDLREKLDKGEMTIDEYNRVIGNTPGNPPPNIKMLILSTTNPIMTHPDVNTNIRAFKKLDFTVVISYHLDNPSARYADIILPQMHRAFEGRDVPFLKERSNDLFYMEMTNMNGNYFVYKQKCVDPPGEVKPRGWVWLQIAKRLGIAEQFSPRLADVPDDKWDETVEGLHREAYEKWALREEITPLNPPSWEEFQKKPVFRWEIKEPYYTYKNDIEHGENPFSGTESGKIEFYSKELAKGPEYLAANVCGTVKKSGVKVQVASGWYGGGNLPPMAQMTKGGRATFHSKDVEKFPLLMSSPHGLFRLHTLLDNQPLLSRDCYRHAVWISVSDAKARGIVDDDLVRVYNDQAEIIMPAYVTSKVIPGTVNIFHGGWYMPSKNKTDLMPEGIDTRGASNLMTHYDEHLPDTIIDHQPCKALVEIEKWEGAR